MNTRFLKVVALMLVSCFVFSACKGKNESENGDSASSAAADPAGSSASGESYPEYVEELSDLKGLPTNGASTVIHMLDSYFPDGQRVYLSTNSNPDVAPDFGRTYSISASDPEGNLRELGEIPGYDSGSGWAHIDSDYYRYVRLNYLPEDENVAIETGFLNEIALLRIDPEKKELELIRFDEPSNAELQSKMVASTFVCGRKAIALVESHEPGEDGMGGELSTFIEVYDVDSKEFTRYLTSSASIILTSGEMVYNVCANGEKIYALQDSMEGAGVTTDLIEMSEYGTELRRYKVGEEETVFFAKPYTGGISYAELYVWNGFVFSQHETGVYFGKLDRGAIGKIEDYSFTELVINSDGGAPILVHPVQEDGEGSTIALITEDGTIEEIRIGIDGASVFSISECFVSGTQLYIGVYYEKNENDLGEREYVIHLDKIGDVKEIFLPT